MFLARRSAKTLNGRRLAARERGCSGVVVGRRRAGDSVEFNEESGVGAVLRGERAGCERNRGCFERPVERVQHRRWHHNRHNHHERRRRGSAANTDPFRTSNPDSLVNSESKPEAMNQLLKRLNFLFPDCRGIRVAFGEEENKLWGIEVVAEAYKSAENVRPSHAAYEQHEAIERHYQVRANCTFFLNDSDGAGEITFQLVAESLSRARKRFGFNHVPRHRRESPRPARREPAETRTMAQTRLTRSMSSSEVRRLKY